MFRLGADWGSEGSLQTKFYSGGVSTEGTTKTYFIDRGIRKDDNTTKNSIEDSL